VNILELLNSTYRLGERRQPAFVFSQKSFGSIYAFNKSVIYKPNNSIVEVSMYITTATELNKSAHKIQIALQGINSAEYTKDNLFSIIKMQTKYNKLTDDEILEKIFSEEELIRDKFIIQSKGNKFLLIDKRIPLTTQIRVKCSCFSGDTKILLADGTYKTLKELEGKNNFKIVAYNKNMDAFEIANAIKCELKQVNAEVLSIYLNDGTIIKSTLDHRFLKSNGEWIEAKYLNEEDTLKSLNNLDITKFKNHSDNESYYTYIYLDPRKEGIYKYNDVEVNHEPFYVGVGSGIKKDIDNNNCFTRMSEIYEEGYTPIVVKQEICVDKHVAYQLKDRLIKNIKNISNGGPLLNRDIVEEIYKENIKSKYKIEKIEKCLQTEDVYCITTQGLGNFIISTSEENSGVVVENCSDYYYTFAYYNADHRVHIGMKPPKYTPYRAIDKNDSDFRPKRNPNRYPGACKHILLFLALLMNGRIINPSNQLLGSFSGNYKKFEIYDRKDISLMLKKLNSELREQNLKIREQRQANKDYIEKTKKGKK